MEEKGDNTESGRNKAIQIKGPQREEKGDNQESGDRGCTDQRQAEGGEG